MMGFYVREPVGGAIAVVIAINWRSSFREKQAYKKTPKGIAAKQEKKAKAEAAVKERFAIHEEMKKIEKDRGYKKPLFPHSSSVTYSLACGHQIIASEQSSHLLNQQVLCEVCNERRTVTNKLPSTHRGK